MAIPAGGKTLRAAKGKPDDANAHLSVIRRAAVAEELRSIEANRVARIIDRLDEACMLGAGSAFDSVETASLSGLIRRLTYESMRTK
jgi:hypothetical protein